jgi:hypothetical protein
MAQQASHSTMIGSTAGQFDAKGSGAMDVDGINKMINSSSSNWGQVSSKLKGYGLSITEDKQFMKSPFGTFPVNATNEEMAAAIKSIAGKFGLSGADVDKAIAAGQAEADAIGRRALAEAQAKLALKGGPSVNKNLESDKGAKDSVTTTTDGDATKAATRDVAAEKPMSAWGAEKYGVDWDQKERELAESRTKLGEALDLCPLYGKDDDIFKKVHEHYVRLDAVGHFLPADTSLPVVASAKRSY